MLCAWTMKLQLSLMWLCRQMQDSLIGNTTLASARAFVPHPSLTSLLTLSVRTAMPGGAEMLRPAHPGLDGRECAAGECTRLPHWRLRQGGGCATAMSTTHLPWSDLLCTAASYTVGMLLMHVAWLLCCVKNLKLLLPFRH